jgi:hypothetical protein
MIFYAKNLAGDIKEISYRNIHEIPILLEDAFGKVPLYNPIWIDEEGDEFTVPRNGEMIYILYRYINVKVIFNYNCILQEIDANSIQYEQYTIHIKKEEMEELYEEISISFLYSSKTFYSKISNIDILEEDYGIKYITSSPIKETFQSIKDLFLSFKDYYHNIPQDFFIHLSECTQERWNIYEEGMNKLNLSLFNWRL